MKRTSGVLMHVSTLWGDYSEGALGSEAKEWIDFLADCGFSYWQTLPFCLPDGFNSPYQSYSAFSVNPFFIDLPTLHREGLITDDELAKAKQNDPYVCEFDRLKEERITLLSNAAKRFGDKNAIDEFYEIHKQTYQFCLFMAYKKANNELPWYEWTERENPDADTLETWKFICFEFCKQWNEIRSYAGERGISIIGDIPIYISLDSADVWANPSQFQLNSDGRPSFVAGVPPDYFSADGQLWGNPLYDWDTMEKDGFKWWRERIGFMCELFDGIRIDHFRGLESYYSIPATEKTAKNGKWKKGPGMKLINELKKVSTGHFLIAEDLGDITPEVVKLVEDSGFPGMRVLQFGFLGDAQSPHLPHNYINNCIAYTGTHDNNTLLGYVWDLDDTTRRRMLEYCGYYDSNWDGCYDHILRMMFASHAGLLILPVQDILLYGNDTRINIPGRSKGNWGYRLTKDQLFRIDRKKFRKWNEMYGRC